MQKLISELIRLYLSAGTLSQHDLTQRMLGQSSDRLSLTSDAGFTRAIVIPFQKTTHGDAAQHWSSLCAVANALQTELGLPAPAVSISGINGYCLWLSLEAPIAQTEAQKFIALLRQAYCPELNLGTDAASIAVELPPALHPISGQWAAFIHPDLGASFADEAGLEMAPPLAGQAALLESLHSISAAQLRHAFSVLEQVYGALPAVGGAVAERAPAPEGLLLQDASLDDIVRWLHAKNIEPTFRYLIPSEVL